MPSFSIPLHFAMPAFDRARDRRFGIAVALSLLVHGVTIGWMPGLAPPEPDPVPLTLHLHTPQPPPVQPERAVSPAPTFRPPAPSVPSVPPVRRAEPPRPESRPPVLAMPAATVAAPAFSVPEADATPPPPKVVEAPRPAPRIEPPATDPRALTGYGRDIAGAVARHQRYPRQALMRQWQGTATLQLQIAADGKLQDVRVISSSGHEILDRQALDMVREAVPLPPMPATLAGRPLTVDVPVVFRLAN